MNRPATRPAAAPAAGRHGSAWMIFWIASIAVILVSLDSTMLPELSIPRSTT